MKKNEYVSCEHAHELLASADKKLREGIKLTVSEMAEYNTVSQFCDNMTKEKVWKDWNREARGAVYPEDEEAEEIIEVKEVKEVHHGGYSHSFFDTDLDDHMNRIINSGSKDMMEKLSGVLSEHFLDLKQINPKMYDVLHKKMSEIKY